MKRTLRFLPLLGLAPLGQFFGPYLDGASVLPHGSGFLVFAGSFFILPWVVAGLFLTAAKAALPIRILLFVCALLVQAVLLFTVVPAGATSEMMGIAHRLRREFPPDQIRDCAARLRQKHRDGTLTVRQGDRAHSFLMSESAVVVDDSDLPVSMRGRFDRVFIQQDRGTSEEQVFFSLGERIGIVCDSRKHVREFLVCSMAEGVHAYRYRRL
jgi:hypothetical protein